MQVVRSGMGVLVPGAFVVPQNPLLKSMGLSGLINGAHFAVPQNPLLGNTTLSGPVQIASPRKNALQTSLRGLSCGQCAAASTNGMGAFDTNDPWTSLADDTSFGVPNYMIAGAVLIAVAFMSGDRTHRARVRVAKSDAAVERARSKRSSFAKSTSKK